MPKVDIKCFGRSIPLLSDLSNMVHQNYFDEYIRPVIGPAKSPEEMCINYLI